MGSFAEVLNRHRIEVEYRNTRGDALTGVLSSAPAAARCALDLQDAMDGIDLEAAGLPAHLALRPSGHVGPVFPILDPVLRKPSFLGSQINHTARTNPSHLRGPSTWPRRSRHRSSWRDATTSAATTWAT
jgi:hypothetical protein